MSSVSEEERKAISGRQTLLIESTKRERDLTIGRASGAQTRATLLVGAAGILGGTDVLTREIVYVSVAALALYLVSAVLGVLALIPDKATATPNIELARKQAEYDPLELQFLLLQYELRGDDRSAILLRRRSRMVFWGFIALTLGWVLTFASTLADQMAPDQDDPIEIRIVEDRSHG